MTIHRRGVCNPFTLFLLPRHHLRCTRNNGAVVTIIMAVKVTTDPRLTSKLYSMVENDMAAASLVSTAGAVVGTSSVGTAVGGAAAGAAPPPDVSSISM